MQTLTFDDATRVLVLTGAGISAESGVPTFRDSNGLWEQHRYEDVASPEGFARDPELVWRFYSQRRQGAAQRGAQCRAIGRWSSSSDGWASASCW